jgi:hypothetical protein
MSDATNAGATTPIDGSTTPAEGTATPAEGSATAGADTSTAGPAAPATPEHARVRNAIRLVKEHPLGAVATVAAAAAFIEVEFAVGLLAGLGATALLAGRSGPEARRQVLSQGKLALDRARTAWARSSKSKRSEAAPQANEAAPPPS